MEGTEACLMNDSTAASNGPPYLPDVRSFLFSKETDESILDQKQVSSDLGLAVANTKMKAKSFNLQQPMIMKPSNYSSGLDMKSSRKPETALPCPRCSSLDTKFCYYNNYNVNQPRHFCKGCQRYWTAGGTLRNVAVGAGRRKRKHSSLEPEFGPAVSSIECPASQDDSTATRPCTDYKSQSSKDSNGLSCINGGLSQNKLQCLSVGSQNYVTDHLTSGTMEGNLSNELVLVPENFGFLHKLGLIGSSSNIRKNANHFHEFMQSHCKIVDNSVSPCDTSLGLLKATNHSPLVDVKNDELKVMSGKLVSVMTAERQASNESGCASSLTTQAGSEDACTNGVKSDVDSEISKEGDNCGKDCRSSYETSELPHPVSYKRPQTMPTVGGFFQCDVTGFGTSMPLAESWKGQVENPEHGAVQAMRPLPLMWIPATEMPLGHTMGASCYPTASAVEAAKAALIPNAVSLRKLQSQAVKDLAVYNVTMRPKEEHSLPVSNISSEQRVWVPKTLRLKDVDEAARSSIWSTLGIRDKEGPLVFGKTEDTLCCRGKESGMQNANPVAMSQSMAFHERV